MLKALHKWLPYVDLSLLGLLFLILSLSLFILSTASYSLVPDDPYHYVKTNAVWIGTGLVWAVAAAGFDYKYTRRAYWALYGLNILMLMVVQFLGVTTRGSQRWLEVMSGIAFQPSEFAKIIVVVTLACFLSGGGSPGTDPRTVSGRHTLSRYRDFVVPFLFVAPPMVLVFLQPDLGTALVFMAIFAGMMFAAGAHPLKFASVLAGTAVLSISAIAFHLATPDMLPKWLKPLAGLPLPLQDYQLNRILVFLHPENEWSGEGYQVMQSVWAVGSGGLWGKGYHMGTQGQHNFIPDHHTDFVFSVLGEEFGFLGASILLFVFCLFLLSNVSVAMKSRDLLGTLIVAGMVSMWAFQFFVNVGMASGIMPVTGLPLPFITSGGSSMWANLMGAGLVFSVYARRERAMF